MGIRHFSSAILITSLVPIIWGSTYIVTTEWLPPNVPLISATLRALPAGLIILLLTRQLPKGIWWLKAIVLGILNIGAFFYCLFVAAYHLPGGVAALVMSVQPVLVLLYNRLFFKHTISPRQGIACLLASVGIGMIVLKGQTTMDTVGILAGLGGALSMATGIVLTKYWGRPKQISLITFTGWQLLFGGLALLPIALMNESLPTDISAKHIAGFSYLCLIGAVLTYTLWFRGIEKLPALSISFISLLSPVSATILGYIVLSQTLSPLQMGGGIAVISAIILAQANQRPHPQTDSSRVLPLIKRND